MAIPKIDRSAWASLVASLIREESAGNQTRFAAAVGVDRKTVGRWLRKEADVSEDKVRAVARALGIPARDLLVQVGYYRPDELPSADADRGQDDHQDLAVDMIRQSDLPLSTKRELVEHLITQRQEYLRQQVAEAARLIALARARRRTG